MPDLRRLSVPDLLARYRKAALSTDPWDRTAAIVLELQRRGEPRELLTLLHDEALPVRKWAAMHALYFAPEEGQQALEQLEQEGNPGSGIVLREWREGLFRPLTMNARDWLKRMAEFRQGSDK